MGHRVGSIWTHQRGDASARAVSVPDDSRRHRPRSNRALPADQERVLELQRLAGNAAVTRALAEGRNSGRVTSVDAIEITREGMQPKQGVQQIREHTRNKATLALTQRGILDAPPLMRAEPAEKTQGGYASKARKVGSIPEPMIHEWWPAQGRHVLGEGSLLEVEKDWEDKLQKGEDEHRDDAKLAWELTWKTVQNTINSFSEKPGPTAATPEDAEKALWRKYVAKLPPDLRPSGDRPSDARQREILAVKPGTFMAWMWEITVARDQRMYHETVVGAPPEGAAPAPKGASVGGIKPHPNFLVPGPSSEAFIDEIRKKYTPGKIIQGSKLKDGDTTGDVSK